MKIRFFKMRFVKKLLPRSLFARSLLILTVPIMLTLSISTYVFFERHWERMAGRLSAAVAGEVAFFANYVERDLQGGTFESGFDQLARGSLKHMQINLKFVDGGKIEKERVNYKGRGDLIKKTLLQELNGKLHHPYRILVDVEEKWIQVQVQLDQGVLIVTSPERRLFSSSGFVFLIWMVGISTILMVVAILFMRNQIRPIKRLAVAAERFGRGRDVPFFKVEGAREVRQAARAFLGMRERIQKQLDQRTAMLAGVSHDLRTPLTRMKLQVEMMPDGADKEGFKSDIDDMQRMMDAYLQFARGEGSEEMQRVDLKDMIARLISNYKRQEFNVHFEGDAKVRETYLRPVAFERCLNNVLSNAQKYADEAWVSLSSDEDNITITVNDNGPGIASEHYEDVFKPFFREEKSRNSKSGGVGLGLPIAQDIVLAHGGDIHLGRSEQGGLRVIIALPI